MKVVIVGSGIVGTSVAYRLAQAGAEVVVVEERRIGGGTSSASYAWVNACEKLTSKAYFELNVAGRDAHARLAEELGGTEWYPRPGILQWQDAEAEAGGVDRSNQAAKFDRLVAWGYPAELLDGDEVARLEPDIAPETYRGRPIIHYPEDGWCHAVLYAGRVAGAARRHGASFVTAKVTGLIVQGSRCGGVQLADGTTVPADVVINCAGRWANEFLDGEDRIPLAPTAGLVVYTAPAGLELTRGLRTPSVNLRPDGGGRLLLRAGDIDKLIDGEAPADAALEHAVELLRRARIVLPALANVPMEASRVAIRPQPADSYSAIGPIPGRDGLYATITHSGVTLAPFIAEAVTDELIRGCERPELANFRPARFKPEMRP
jgi:glycine/D-amino acid oxidase-like deaminating enzyme